MSMTGAKVIANYDDIVAIAEAIRNKTGSTEQMSLADMAIAIDNMELSGVEVSYSNGVLSIA